MPFDPALPVNGSPLVSAEMRSQLNGLKDLIDALTAINAAQVDGVTTVNPGDPAAVSLSVVGSTLHFSFELPRGLDGQDGAPGPPFTHFVVDGVTTVEPHNPATVAANFDGNAVRLQFSVPRGFTGSDGQTGSAGPQGPAFASALIDGVTTLNPGENATVVVSFDGSNVHFQFGVPRGFPGNDGGAGPQGQPGEVTNMQLNSAIGGTSSNSNAVSTLGMTVSDPPIQSQVQTIADKLDELILALRR